MKLRRVTTEQFKQTFEAKESTDNLLAVKGCAAVVEKDEGDVGDRILTFTISTGDVDRDGDTLDPNGWELDNFLKGGSMLWAHDSKVVVAKPLATWLEDGKLKSRAQFMPKEMNEFSFMTFEMFRDGYVRGVSVGFLPKEWKENRDRGGWMPLDFLRQELLEFSGTPVPSNPNALREAKSAGIDVTPYVDWAEPFLDGEETEAGLLVSRELAEQMYRSAKGDAPIVVEKSQPEVPSSSPMGREPAGEPTPQPATAANMLKNLREQIDRAVAMVGEKATELADDIQAVSDLLGKGVPLNDEARAKLTEALESLVKILGPPPTQEEHLELDFEIPVPEPDGEDVIEGLDAETVRDAISEMVTQSVEDSFRRLTGRVD